MLSENENGPMPSCAVTSGLAPKGRKSSASIHLLQPHPLHPPRRLKRDLHVAVNHQKCFAGRPLDSGGLLSPGIQPNPEHPWMELSVWVSVPFRCGGTHAHRVQLVLSPGRQQTAPRPKGR